MTTDKELAAKLRMHLDEANKLAFELRKRGFALTGVPIEEFSARKTEEIIL